MKKNQELGGYFWRNGKKIPLEREEEFFTVIVKDEEELERLKSLEGVSEVKRVQNRLFKVQVSKKMRDAAMERFRSKEMGGICHHAYRPKGATNTRYYITDKIVVRFNPHTPQKKIESILLKAGVKLLKEYPGMPNTFLLLVTSEAKMNPIKVANLLVDMDEVEYAEPNIVNRFQKSYVPMDTYFPNQWHLRAHDGLYLVADADVSATEAWDTTKGKRDIVIAVLDDGFDLSHPDFSVQGKVVHPKDYVDGDSSPFPVAEHGDYHGTPCAGVALAEENGVGVVGVAPGCAFMPVRFPLTADDNFMEEIFDYVGKRADVISCSWGPPPVNAPLGQLMFDKFHQLATSGGPRKNGCVIVFAACNYNAPLNDENNVSFKWYHPYYGFVETREPILNGEATHPDVIAVSASTSLNRKAAYSNWGKEVSVCSPSDNWHPLDPNALLPGRGIWTTDNEYYGSDFTGGSRYTGHFGGTSSAAPLVAGIAGLIRSVHPDISALDVKKILQDTADKIEDLNPDPVLNHEKGTYDASGHSEWFGYGKVNAAKSVERARELLKESTGVTDLEMSAVAEGHLEKTDDSKCYRLSIGKKLIITLQGPEDEDFDLYIKQGSAPTQDEYDARGYTSSANEKIILHSIGPGDYYIMVHSFNGSGDFHLKGKLVVE